jgi:hypothetical protein
VVDPAAGKSTAAPGRDVDSLDAGRPSGVQTLSRHQEDAMKYLCMIYFDEKAIEGLSSSEQQALRDEAFAYDEELRQAGHLIVAQALQPVETATAIRVRKGKMYTTDGPFVETKEQLGGFILIEARDLNEAIQLAVQIPPARLGGVEVRPIMEHARR